MKILRKWKERLKTMKQIAIWEKQLKQAIKIAEKLRQEKGEQQFVLLNASNGLMVIDANDLRRLQRCKIIAKRVKIVDLVKESYYMTSDKFGARLSNEIMQVKRKMYFDHMNHVHNINPFFI